MGKHDLKSKCNNVSRQALVRIANALSVSTDDLLCDNVLKAKPQFEEDIARVLADCDDYEIRIIADIAKSVKDTLRRDARLRTKTN